MEEVSMVRSAGDKPAPFSSGELLSGVAWAPRKDVAALTPAARNAQRLYNAGHLRAQKAAEGTSLENTLGKITYIQCQLAGLLSTTHFGFLEPAPQTRFSQTQQETILCNLRDVCAEGALEEAEATLLKQILFDRLRVVTLEKDAQGNVLMPLVDPSNPELGRLPASGLMPENPDVRAQFVHAAEGIAVHSFVCQRVALGAPLREASRYFVGATDSNDAAPAARGSGRADGRAGGKRKGLAKPPQGQLYTDEQVASLVEGLNLAQDVGEKKGFGDDLKFFDTLYQPLTAHTGVTTEGKASAGSLMKVLCSDYQPMLFPTASLSPEVRLENEAWTWKLPGGSDYTLNPNFSLILLISLLAKNPEVRAHEHPISFTDSVRYRLSTLKGDSFTFDLEGVARPDGASLLCEAKGSKVGKISARAATVMLARLTQPVRRAVVPVTDISGWTVLKGKLSVISNAPALVQLVGGPAGAANIRTLPEAAHWMETGTSFVKTQGQASQSVDGSSDAAASQVTAQPAPSLLS